MRRIALALFLVPGFVNAQVAMDAFRDGKLVGAAKFEAKLNPDGGKTTILSLALSLGAARGTQVIETQVVDSQGRQTLAEVKVLRQGTVLSLTSATFADNGDAHVSIQMGSKKRTVNVPCDRRYSRKDVSDFWFVKKRPNPGMWVQFESFNLDKLTWIQMRTTYEGSKPVTVGGKSIVANVISQVRGSEQQRLCVDDHGDPYLIEAGRFKMERRR